MNVGRGDDLTYLAAHAAHVLAAATGPAPASTHAEMRDWAARIEICPENPTDACDVLSGIVADVLDRSVDPSHPHCVAHLHCATIPVAATTEMIIGSINQSMDSYDQAPAATHVEERVLAWLAGQLGLVDGGGVMTAGGTASNLLALTLARARAARTAGFDVRVDGLPAVAARWRIVASTEAHFSIERAAALLGLGTSAVVRVPADASGRIDVVELETTLAALDADGCTTIAVVATAGTTDLGAIDPISDVARVARAHGAWVHVDAAVTSAFVLSERLSGLLAGVEAADSVTCDFHKLWFLPISASALIVADTAVFDGLDEHHDYLNREEDSSAGVLNLVDRSLDTSRRFDALKLLVAMHTLGRSGYAAAVEHCVDTVSVVAHHIAGHPGFELVAPAGSVTVVFRWTRAGLDDETVDAVNDETARRLFDDGVAVVGRTKVAGRTALKFTVVNPATTVADLTELLSTIAGAARTIADR